MKKRRAIGIILTAVAMAFAMVPLTGNNKAFAQGDDVATIGDNGYASLAAAVQAAGTNKTTIKLVLKIPWKVSLFRQMRISLLT